MIKGKLIGLCPLENEDLEFLRTWRNNPNFRQYFREYREISKDMQAEWYKRTLNDKSTIMFAVRRLSDNALLGCCGLCYINWVNRNADLSLYIGYDDLYIDEEFKLICSDGNIENGVISDALIIKVESLL